MIIHIFSATHILCSHLLHPGLWHKQYRLWVLWASLCTHFNFILWIPNQESNLKSSDCKNEVIIETTLIHTKVLKISPKFQFFMYNY